MKTDKKAEIKRLVIYFVIAFIPLCIMTAILNSTVDDGYIYNHIEDKMAVIYVSGVLAMFCPSIAVILTRIITKEGFRNNYLGINFKGNKKYYAASLLVILAQSFVNMLLMWKLYSTASFGEMFSGENISEKLWWVILNIEASVIIFFLAFGEEWGWRGYMMPKLIELMGKPAAVVVGGILWGLWHAPLTMSGHNFGTDYMFFPWLGIALMCVFCTGMNAFLTLLSERTRSVYPCAIAHGINNNINAVMLMNVLGNTELLNTETDFSLQSILPAWSFCVLVGIVSFILFIRNPHT